MSTASELDCWLFWLLHAHEYEPELLAKLLPQPAIRRATEVLSRIAQLTEDKAMYDAREKALRDRKWEIDTAKEEGRIEGKIELEKKKKKKKIRDRRQDRTGPNASGTARAAGRRGRSLAGHGPGQLQAMTGELQDKLRGRKPSSPGN